MQCLLATYLALLANARRAAVEPRKTRPLGASRTSLRSAQADRGGGNQVHLEQPGPHVRCGVLGGGPVEDTGRLHDRVQRPSQDQFEGLVDGRRTREVDPPGQSPPTTRRPWLTRSGRGPTPAPWNPGRPAHR